MSTMGQRIKQIRQELNLSQEQFGKIFGSGKSYISAVENDKSKLSIENLVKLLVNHDVNINYILAEVGQPFNQKPFEQDELEQKVVEVMKKYGVIQK